MRRLLRLLFWLASLALAAAAGAWWAGRPQRAVALVVHEQAVPRSRVDSQLQLYRKQAVEVVVLDQLVTSKAAELGLTYDEPVETADYDSELAAALALEARTRVLLRRLVLHSCSQAERQEVYQLFKDQLTLYEFEIVELESNSGRHFVGTRAQLRDLVGEKPLAGLAGLKVNQVSGPHSSLSGPITLQMVRRYDQYSELLPSIEEILYRAKVELYCLDLGVESARCNLALPPEAEAETKTKQPAASPIPAAPELPKLQILRHR